MIYVRCGNAMIEKHRKRRCEHQQCMEIVDPSSNLARKSSIRASKMYGNRRSGVLNCREIVEAISGNRALANDFCWQHVLFLWKFEGRFVFFAHV